MTMSKAKIRLVNTHVGAILYFRRGLILKEPGLLCILCLPFGVRFILAY